MSLTARLVVTKESASLNIMKTDFTANATPVIQGYHAVSHGSETLSAYVTLKKVSPEVHNISRCHQMACKLCHDFQTLTIRH